MHIGTLARLAGIGTLAGMLAACVDVEMVIDVLDQDHGRGTMTMTVDKPTYEMMTSQGDSSDFCADGEIVENEDNVQCVQVEEGSFADLLFSEDSDEPQPQVTAEGGGRVRVSFPTSTITEGMGADSDPQSQAMMAAMFEGNTLTLTVTGGPIVDTNMELAPDGQSASLTVLFTDLFNGTVELPDISYAVVQK
jgi:hypothetical protein